MLCSAHRSRNKARHEQESSRVIHLTASPTPNGPLWLRKVCASSLCHARCGLGFVTICIGVYSSRYPLRANLAALGFGTLGPLGSRAKVLRMRIHLMHMTEQGNQYDTCSVWICSTANEWASAGDWLLSRVLVPPWPFLKSSAKGRSAA